MKIEKIKPIPKYIERLIKKKDLEAYSSQYSYTRFYAYLTKNDGELTKVTVAVKNHKEKWYCKQVAVHGIHSEKCFLKDMIRCYIGGFHVGWYDMGIQRHQKWYEDGEWGWAYDSDFDPFAPVVNMNYIGKFPEYKYSGYQCFTRHNILQYLRIYEQFPQAEYLVKMGLSNLAMRKQILRKAEKDKPFRKWLFVHREELKDPHLYVSSVFTAYKTGKPVAEVQTLAAAKKNILGDSYRELRLAFAHDLDELLIYIGKQKTSIGSYNDYFKACRFLHLDMRLPRNRYPHDFKRWHDIRIDEYHSAEDEQDELKRKALYEKFAVIAEKYHTLQDDRTDGYICLIAHSPLDLIREGRALQHCVGHMGYDQKFVREESLIFFIRKRDEPQIPFVTLEYSLSSRKVLQCYGYNNTRPDEKVLDYVNRVWQPYANRKIKKIMMAA